MKNVPIVSVGININYVTIFEKTWHMGSVCNVHFWYLRSNITKVLFLSYSCQITFLPTLTIVY